MTTPDAKIHDGHQTESANAAGAGMQVSDLTGLELEHYLRRAHHLRAQALASAGRRLAAWLSAGSTATSEPSDNHVQPLDLNSRLSGSH